MYIINKNFIKYIFFCDYIQKIPFSSYALQNYTYAEVHCNMPIEIPITSAFKNTAYELPQRLTICGRVKR